MGYHDKFKTSSAGWFTSQKSHGNAVMIRIYRQTAKNRVDDFGFDPVVIGRPANGLMLEPGGELFGASETKTNLNHLIETFYQKVLKANNYSNEQN